MPRIWLKIRCVGRVQDARSEHREDRVAAITKSDLEPEPVPGLKQVLLMSQSIAGAGPDRAGHGGSVLVETIHVVASRKTTPGLSSVTASMNEYIGSERGVVCSAVVIIFAGRIHRMLPVGRPAGSIANLEA